MPFATVRRSLMLFWDVGPIGEVAALVAVLAALLVGPLMGAAITGTAMLRLAATASGAGLKT